MYDGIQKAVGPTVRKMAPLKSTSGEMLTDRDKQMERWVEHYSELYSRETVVTNAALNAIRDLPIVALYKNKVDLRDCNNYRGISLLSIVGKAFARVLLIRLQKLASRVYPESQCRFRAGRSTLDMIFSVRQLQ